MLPDSIAESAKATSSNASHLLQAPDGLLQLASHQRRHLISVAATTTANSTTAHAAHTTTSTCTRCCVHEASTAW
jgi:hypothetical protein